MKPDRQRLETSTMVKTVIRIFIPVVGLWFFCAGLLSFFDVNIFWPIFYAQDGGVPLHRLYIARNGVFLTFGFYCFMFLWDPYRQYRPVHFLKTYLTMALLSALLVTVKRGLYVPTEMVSIGVGFLALFIIHYGAKMTYSRLFEDN